MDTTDHKAKMKQMQKVHRAAIAERDISDRGLVLVHTGDGKGKSSSAFGVVIRALGWGHKVAVVQFIKGTWDTGEKRFFDQLDMVDWFTMGEGFTWDTQDKDRDIAAATKAYEKACTLMSSGDYDLVVLDEVNIALRYDYLDTETVLDGLKSRNSKTSVVLTGRDAKPEICDYADLVSEIQEIKHPFQAGIKAMKGVDY